MRNIENKDIGHGLLLAAGFLAAGIFVLVSMAANFRFGLTFGTTDLDRLIYGSLSLGADLFKVALPIVVMILWRIRYRVLSATGAVLWLLLVFFSVAAAVGFAAETRGVKVSSNQTAIDSRQAWKATIERVEKQLDQLGIPRAASVIHTEIDALLRTPGADGCTVINGPVTEDVCPKVDVLRKELAVADRVAELEAELVAARSQLRAVPAAASVADPQSATLARIVPFDEVDIRDMLAFLIAAIVETGSALGFTFMLLAARARRETHQQQADALEIEAGAKRRLADEYDAAQPDGAEKGGRPKTVPDGNGFTAASVGLSRKDIHEARTLRDAEFGQPPADTITRWAFARLDILKAGRIQANAAYVDFKHWCEAEGIEVCTPQMFGRRFTKVIEGMGGRKVKINGRAYYEGVALQPSTRKSSGPSIESCGRRKLATAVA